MAEEEEKGSEVKVNTDPAIGPLDAASAEVKISKTIFKGRNRFKQEVHKGKIDASYEIGVVSIKNCDGGVMFTVRLDELMAVLVASSNAYKRIYTRKDGDGDSVQ